MKNLTLVFTIAAWNISLWYISNFHINFIPIWSFMLLGKTLFNILSRRIGLFYHITFIPEMSIGVIPPQTYRNLWCWSLRILSWSVLYTLRKISSLNCISSFQLYLICLYALFWWYTVSHSFALRVYPFKGTTNIHSHMSVMALL